MALDPVAANIVSFSDNHACMASLYMMNTLL